MKIVSINLGNFGSTGTIMREISKKAESYGYVCYNAYPWDYNNKAEQKNDILIGTKFSKKVSVKLARLTGYLDKFAYFSSLRFIGKLKQIKPDIIHLHNLHNSYLNLSLLFKYIKKYNVKTIWTLHDCWAFTGRCPHFVILNCQKWLDGCEGCAYSLSDYPKVNHNRAEKLWDLKKKLFTNIQNMTIVTPSRWLSDLVKQSYLGDYEVKVIYNGIDLNVFKPTESDLREKFALQEKKIILGVALQWDIKKGLDVFIELFKHLSDDYQIVLVGVDDIVKKELPQGIIAISCTNSPQELAQIYSAADVFVNPTRQEVLGMVNLEALACGTPVITFDTGGSPETIDESCGIVVPINDMLALIESIHKACEEKLFSSVACLERAQQFEYNKKFEEYMNLYREKEMQ